MNTYDNVNVTEEKLDIAGIPCLRFFPSEKSQFVAPYPTVVYYHGWSSSKTKQRFIAYVFATMGYQVILPEAINHGERGSFPDYVRALNKHFLPTIMQNLKEFPLIYKHIAKNCQVDTERFAVAGHSMGGYTTAGIFTHNPEVKASLIFNGACDWQNAIFEIEKTHHEAHIEFDEQTKITDPAQNIEKILNRPMFLLHGIKDTLVSYKIQKQFYDKIHPLYTDKSKLKLMSVERMNHYISVQMLDSAIQWLNEVFK